MIVVTHTRIVTPEGVLEEGTLLAEGSRIVQIADRPGAIPPHAEVVDGRGLTVLPGFLDLHVHGGGGADVMDATPDALRTLCRTHARQGTTGLLATTMTQSGERIHAALENAREAWKQGPDFCPDGAQVLGVHLEGPYLSPKRAGAQPIEWIRRFDAAEFTEWLDAAGGAMKLLTCAPEEADADALFARARGAGIVVSIGHTDASTAQVRTAFDRGATHATHLFNQMRPLHHREPGPIGVSLTDERVRVEVIADGHHVAPEIAQLILRAKGTCGVILITDAMAGAGAPEGLYELGGLPVTVAGGRATLADGTLAGSVLTMDRAAANVRAWTGIGWSDIARLTSTNAAEQMGWTSKGHLTPGGDADFVLVDDAMNVHATFIAGRCVWRR